MALCPASILACGMRVTLLDDLGNVADVPNNYWVTANLIEIQTSPEIEAGTDLTMKSGCDAIIAAYRGPDLFKRFNFELSLGALEPGLLSLMLGGSVILDGTDPIGMGWPNQTTCAGEPPPFVALEVWSYSWDCLGQAPGTPYIHWTWPMTRWQIGQSVLGASDFFRPALTGFSLANGQWGEGPYGDGPGEDIPELGAFWFTAEAPPAAACAYQSVTPAS